MPNSVATALSADLVRQRPARSMRLTPARAAAARTVSAAPALSGAIATSEAEVTALRSEWDALAARTTDATMAQGFAWCWAGWQTTAKPRGRTLAVLVVRDAGQLVLVWPMARVWRELCAELIPLGSEATDYNPLLVAPTQRAGAYVRTALALLRREGRAGLVAMPLLRSDSPASPALSAMAPAVLAAETLPAPFLDISSPARIAAYEQAMSKNLRRGTERRRRRLAELGTLRFEVITDPTQFAELLDWTIAAKAVWLREHHLQSEFLHAPHYRAFWLAALRAGGPGGQVCGIALRHDDRTIAAKVVVLTANRLEGFLTTFDADFARFSPGQILLLDTFRWCADKGLSYDFRIGDEAFKWDWTQTSVGVTNFVLPLSRAGWLLHRMRLVRAALCRAKDRLRATVPTSLRQRIKGWLQQGAGEAPAEADAAPN